MTVIVSKSIKSSSKKLLKMLARKPNLIENASVLTKSPNYKLGDLQNVEYLFVAGFQFREEFVRMQLKCDLLVGALIYFATPEIAKMLHNVYKSCIGNYPLRKPFTVDLPC
jgi:hypothetical protein